MAYTLLGRIRPVYKGAWSASTAYTVLEMVRSADGRAAYIALKDVPKGVPVTNESYWGVVLDVSDALDAADEAIEAAVSRADEAADRANTAASQSPLPLVLTEDADPALIWPDAGSALRPVVRIEAAQSGEGNPYPGGAGLNLFDIFSSQNTGMSVDDDGWITVEIDNSAGTATKYVSVYTPASDRLAEGQSYSVVCEVSELTGGFVQAVGSAETSNKGQFGEAFTVRSAGTSVARIAARDDFAGCTTMLRTVCAASAGESIRAVFRISVLENEVSAGSFVYQPYANIRPISGRTSTKLVRCGKNLIDAENYSRLSDGVTLEAVDGGVRIHTGEGREGAWYGASYNTFHISAGVTVIGSIDVMEYVSGELRFGLRNASTSSFLSGAAAVAAEAGHFSFAFTAKEDMRVYPSILVTGRTAAAGDATVANVQIEIGSEETQYEPYRGDAFSRAFGQRVYGGALDADSGQLTITHSFAELTGEEYVESRTGSDGLTYYVLSSLMSSAPASGALNLTCSHYPAVSNVYSGGQGVRFTDSLITVMLRDKRFQDSPDVDGLKAYFAEQAAAGTPVQFCWELAQPQTVQLSSLKLAALEGPNAVYADGDGLTVTYSKSLVREREELLARIAALEAAAVNNI